MAKAKNCLISIPDYGKAAVWVETLTHGLSIFNLGKTEGHESRTRRHFFTSHRSSGGFTIDLIFSSHKAQENFQNWIEEYSRWAADPNTDAAPARVVIPSRNFDKAGILDGSFSYGDEFGKILYNTSLKFMGGKDPVDMGAEGANLVSIGIQGKAIRDFKDDEDADGARADFDLVRLQPWASATGSLSLFSEVGAYSEGDFSLQRFGPQ